MSKLVWEACAARSGTAYVSELEDADYFLTGRFDGHWERGDGGFEQLEETSFEDALAWARERAPVVVVDLGSGARHSVGDEPDPEFPPLPADLGPFVRRRDPEFAYLDRTEADEPIEWSASLDYGLDGKRLGAFAERFLAAVHEDPRVVSVTAVGDAGSSRVAVDVSFAARTFAQADELCAQVLDDAIRAAEPTGESGGVCAAYAGVGNLRPTGVQST